MELTIEIIEKYGFKRINNSMYRKGNITLQNTRIHEGSSVLERIINTKKGYKICIRGKFVTNIISEGELLETLKSNKHDKI